MATGPSDHALTVQMKIKDIASNALNKIKSEFGSLGSAIHLVTGLFQNFNTAIFAVTQAIAFTGVLAIIKLAKEVFVLNENIAVMGQRFGMNRLQVKEFNTQLFESSRRAGLMVDQTAHMSKALMEAGFKDRRKELTDLSTTLFKFSAVTGVSVEVGAEFAAELNKMGYNTEGLLRQMGSLRSSFNLSTRELENIVKVIKEAGKAFYIFGGALNPEQLQLNVAGTAKLAAQMADLGLATEESNEQMMAWLDIQKWETSGITQQLGYGYDELFKTQAEGYGDATEKLIDLHRRLRNFTDFNDQAIKNTLIQSKVLSDNQAVFYTRLYNMSEDEIRMSGEKNRGVKDLNKLYLEQGDILKPLQKQWQALLAEAMPEIKKLVGGLGKVLEYITKIFEQIHKHPGSGKALVYGILGLGGLVALISTAKWLLAIGVGAKIAIGVAGAAGTGMSGLATVLGITAIEGAALATTLGTIVASLQLIAGAAIIAGFATWGAMKLANKAKVDFSGQMGNVFDPIQAISSWSSAFGVKIGRKIGGMPSKINTEATTGNINQYGNQIVSSKIEQDQKLVELLKGLLETLINSTNRTGNLIENHTDTYKQEESKKRGTFINNKSTSDAASYAGD